MPAVQTTPRPVRGMMAVSNKTTKKIKPLGYIVWFSIPDREVTLRQLTLAWLKGGLERECLPKDPRAKSIFMRAVRKQQGRVKHDDGSITETDVKDVLDSEQFTIYQISRIVRDVQEREVTYPRFLTVIFNKETHEIKFKHGEGVRGAEATIVKNEIMDEFDGGAKKVNGHKVRTLVRKYLKEDTDEGAGVYGLSGQNMRGKAGGVYFVAERHKPQLDGLGECLSELYSPDGPTYGLYTVPLADGRSQREMVRAHYAANTLQEVDEATAKVRKLLRSDRENAVRSDVSRHWRQTLHAMKRRVVEYDDMLKGEHDDIDTRLDVLDRQIQALP